MCTYFPPAANVLLKVASLLRCTTIWSRLARDDMIFWQKKKPQEKTQEKKEHGFCYFDRTVTFILTFVLISVTQH